MSGKRFNIKKFVTVSAVALAMISGGALLTNTMGKTIHADDVSEDLKIDKQATKGYAERAARDEAHANYEADKSNPSMLAYDLEYAPERLKGHKQELINRLTPKQKRIIKWQMASDNGETSTAPSDKDLAVLNSYQPVAKSTKRAKVNKKATKRHANQPKRRSRKVVKRINRRKRRTARKRKARRIVKRTRKPRVRRNKRRAAYRIKPTYEAGYKFGQEYDKLLSGLYKPNQSTKKMFNNAKTVYLNRSLSNRNYARGFIKGYVALALKTSPTIAYGGETKESLTAEAKDMINAYNKLIHHGHAYKLGFFNTMVPGSVKVSNQLKHSHQYKLGAQLGQLELQ